jgi:TM2 domain-containing membrane protein YozV
MSETTGEQKPAQKKMMMFLICWVIGWTGLHRMMMGHKNWWLMLITVGGCGIWQIIDLIMILTGSLKMADGRPLE